MVAAVNDCGTAIQDAQVPMKSEIMLTVSWSCPVCGSPLTLTKRMRAEPECHLFAGTLHPGPEANRRCPENV
jgi:hypothetical protein